MSWEFTAFDMIWVKNTIQKELGIQWTSIPIELSLWIKKTQRKSCNTWQLLSFRKGYQGILLNVYVEGIQRETNSIKMHIGLPQKSKKPYYKGYIQELRSWIQQVIDIYDL